MAKAQVQLGLDASLFQRGIALAEGTMARFGAGAARIGRLVTGALGGIGVGLSAGAFALGIKRVIDLGDKLEELKAKTDIPIGQLVRLQQTFADSGMSAEDLGSAIARMQNAIASGPDAFKLLNINVQKLATLQPSEQFFAIGKAIASIQSPALRTAASMDIFGRSGANLLAVFRDPEFGKASKQIEVQAGILEKNSETFARVSDKLSRAGLSLRTFNLSMAAEIAKPLEAALDRLDKMNLSPLGTTIGKGIAKSVETNLGYLRSLGGMLKAMGDKVGITMPSLPTLPEGSAPQAPAHGIGGLKPPDFWRTPAAGTFGVPPLLKRPIDPFMSKNENFKARMAEFDRRFGDNAEEPEFIRKFMGSNTDQLEQWGARMGAREGAGQGMDRPYKSGGYNLIRRGDAERAKGGDGRDAIPGGGNKAVIDKKSMDEFASTVSKQLTADLEKKIPG